MRPAAILIVIAIFASPGSALSQAEFEGIRNAAAERRYDEAIEGLSRIETVEPELFRDLDLDYLLGRLYEKRGDPGAALARYTAVAARGTDLRAYALFHSASAARAMGNHFAERLYLRELAATEPQSLVAEAARVRMARSFLDSADFERASIVLDALRPSSSPDSPASGDPDPVHRENRIFAARARTGLGDGGSARTIFVEVIRSWPSPGRPDDPMIAAVRDLDRLDLAGDPVRKVPSLSADEHFSRAAVYLFDRDLPAARSHYNAVVTEHPASPLVPEALFQIGRCQAQESDFPGAIRTYERILEQYPDDPAARKALLHGASAYSRVGKHRESVRRYQDYIARFPSEPDVDRAYLNIIDVLRDAGEETEALKWTATISEKYSGKITDAQGVFAAARIHIARNNWDDALLAIDRLLQMADLGGARVPGGTTREEVLFLRAFILEQKRSFAEAVDAYLAIPDGRNEYYGGRATERLRALAGDEDARPVLAAKLNSLTAPPFEPNAHEANRRRAQDALRITADPAERSRLLEVLKRAYSNLPAYKNVPAFKMAEPAAGAPRSSSKDGSVARPGKTIAEKLFFLGLFDEAAPELEASDAAKRKSANDLPYTIADVNARGGRAQKAIAFAEPAWRPVPADYQIELIGPDQMALLYPAVHHDLFERYTRPRGVDPRFLLSLARQESRFDPAARSDAAARGLMQFTLPTARKTASALGIADLEIGQLYDPATSILFASEYAASLFTLFPKQPEAVAASYNGGEENMNRWEKRSKSDAADRFVPEIAYAQSKDYVYKVMAAYRIYRMRYDPELKPLP